MELFLLDKKSGKESVTIFNPLLTPSHLGPISDPFPSNPSDHPLIKFHMNLHSFFVFGN